VCEIIKKIIKNKKNLKSTKERHAVDLCQHMSWEAKGFQNNHGCPVVRNFQVNSGIYKTPKNPNVYLGV